MIRRLINLFRRERPPESCDCLFVYGTLRQEYKHICQVAKDLHAHSNYLGAATADGYEMRVISSYDDQPLFPIAMPSATMRMHGQILKFKPNMNHLMLQELDHYEGDMYSRDIVKINDLWCYMYVVNDPTYYMWHELVIEGDWVLYVKRKNCNLN